jgi:hypothetical protein
MKLLNKLTNFINSKVTVTYVEPIQVETPPMTTGKYAISLQCNTAGVWSNQFDDIKIFGSTYENLCDALKVLGRRYSDDSNIYAPFGMFRHAVINVDTNNTIAFLNSYGNVQLELNPNELDSNISK